MILSAQSICRRAESGLIAPFHEREVFEGMSFGLSCHGYDVRVAEEIHLTRSSDFVLASTIECFDMPRDLCAFVKDKSSWARRGVFVQNTVIEAGWRGFLTLEITFQGSGYIRILPGSPIAQIIFQRLDEPTEQIYSGKYQDQQAGPQAARFERGEGAV